jgi:hypothetical protein
MTDYFGALLRSAGAVPVGATARATPTATADLIEQEVELEVGAAESVAVALSPEKPAGIEPAPHRPTEATPAPPEPRQARRSEPASSPFTRPEVHPVVRAALEWVAADPESGERDVSEVYEPERASDQAPRRQLPPVVSQSARTARPAAADVTLTAAATEPVRAERRRQAPPLPRVEHEPAPERQTAAQHLSPVRELDFTLPRDSRRRPDAIKTIDDVAPGPLDRTEVSIGTIHVHVDAPAPRVVVQPAQPQRSPQPARPADPSGFSRSRLPRV